MYTIKQNIIFNFLLRHRDFSIDLISNYYPFTKDELHKYNNLLNWGEISANESIEWTEQLYNEFSEKIDHGGLANNKSFPWTEEFIAKHYEALFQLDEEGLDGMFMSLNPSLPFSHNFIDTYKSIWRWGFLSSNPGVPFTIELIDEFKDYWIREEFELNERLLSDPVLKLTLGLNDSRCLISNVHNCVYCYQDMYYVFEQGTIDLHKIFHCPNFKWDFYLFQLIKERADEKKEFKDPLIYLEESDTIPWSIELLELFENHWNYHMLSMNPSIGNYIISEINSAGVIDELLKRLSINEN